MTPLHSTFPKTKSNSEHTAAEYGNVFLEELGHGMAHALDGLNAVRK